MKTSTGCQVSVVVPLYNEAVGLEHFHKALLSVLKSDGIDDYEIVYCDDGSTDSTADHVKQWHEQDARIKLIRLSRNFGKENALSAGIAQARGQAIITLDGDGQHPVELIPKFIEAWEQGAQVVVGVRTNNQSRGMITRGGSWLFYRLFNSMARQKLIIGSTDYRLIDHSVQQAFLQLGESNRITRGLIDWLGFRRHYIHFQAGTRGQGDPAYSRRKLMKLAADSFVSLSPTPLYLFGYLGIFITSGAFLLGSAVVIEQLILEDPWHWKFTGTAMLGILILFLVGLILISQGILSLYISHIHSQSKQRPLYVIDYDGSIGLKNQTDA